MAYRDFAWVKVVIKRASIVAVVDHVDLFVRQFIEPLDLVLQSIRNGNHSIRAERSVPFVIVHARRVTPIEVVAVAAVFGRVHRQDSLATAAFLDLRHRVGDHPIVRMNDVKASDTILNGAEFLDKRTAHVVRLVNELRVQFEAATMIVNVVDTRVC